MAWKASWAHKIGENERRKRKDNDKIKWSVQTSSASVQINFVFQCNPVARLCDIIEPRHEKIVFFFCICGNKDADQHLCFRTRIVNPSSILIRNCKPLAIFCGCTARFVSDLVGNPEDRFSHNEA